MFDLSGVDLSNADLTGADLFIAILNGTNLRNADLTGANLTNAFMRGAELTQSNLTGADLSYADLSGADLTGADLSGVNLRDANLYNAIGIDNLSEEQLASTYSQVPFPTISHNDNDGIITADEVGGWAGVSGMAYPGTTVTLVSTSETTGVSETLTAVANDAGLWAITMEDAEQPLNGKFKLSVAATDGDGNVSGRVDYAFIDFDIVGPPSETLTFQVDRRRW